MSTMYGIIGSLMLGSAAGHIIMNTPVPYNAETVQVDPLNGDTLKFPCQGHFNAPPADTPLVAGGFQTVKFTGSAVHGGGSCQFSVNYDSPPSADPAKWKTIFTIIGGCPADSPENVAKNGNDAQGRVQGVQCGNSEGMNCTRQFKIPIPKGLPNGKASFAWTWFNRIGHSEMYMNCAPVNISGGAQDRTFLDSLPPIFVANYPGQCTTDTSANKAINIPNPGQFGAVLGPFGENNLGSCHHSSVPKPTFPHTMTSGSGLKQSGSGGGGGGGGGGGSPSTSVAGAHPPFSAKAAASSPLAPSGTATGVFITSPPASAQDPTTTTTLASDTASPSSSGPVLDPTTNTAALPSGTASLSSTASSPSGTASLSSSSVVGGLTTTATLPVGTTTASPVDSTKGSSSTPTVSASPDTSSVASEPTTSIAPGTMTTSATVVASETTTITPNTTTASSATAAVSETSAVSSVPTGTGSPDSSRVPCSVEGLLICIGNGFGLCDHGFAVRQPLAAGTSCKDGKIMKRSYRAYPMSKVW